jgi:hypothetical protein
MQTEIKVGQVWMDNDYRSNGRVLEVVHVTYDGKLIHCRVLTEIGGRPAKKEREARIKRERFRPTSNGYRLLKDVKR